VTETPPAADTHEGQTSTTTGAVTTPASTPVVSKIVLTTNGASSTDNFFENPALVALNGYDYLVSNTTVASSLATSTTVFRSPAPPSSSPASTSSATRSA